MNIAKVVGCGHFGVTVSDIECTKAFFVEVLGFSTGAEVSLSPDFCSSVTGVADAQIEACFVEGHGIVVELLRYRAPDDRGRIEGRSCDSGAAHLAFYVTSITGILAEASAYGWQAAGVPTAITVGPRAGGKACYVTNADGIVLEFVELPKS
ncbi:VOC family protein [Leucobacter sp. Z1108]|uniref:VOC family protein n=1 Tax=Leucobacter sp. Z1108 TaxID=3439066 RepID=UPI003F35468F